MNDQVVSVTLATFACHQCGGVYGLAARFVQEARNIGPSKDWLCPYCKVCTCFTEGEIQRLRKQVVAKDAALDQERARSAELCRQRDRNERRRRATAGVLTKVKKRIAAGVCPCCRRTFQNLASHMKGQHPGYAATEAEA